MQLANLNNKEFLNELRCLRKDLSPLLNPDRVKVLEEAERRLAPGGVSTSPAAKTSQEKKTRNTITKKQRFNKYYYKD